MTKRSARQWQKAQNRRLANDVDRLKWSLDRAERDLAAVQSRLDNALLTAQRLSEAGVQIRCNPRAIYTDQVRAEVTIDSRMLHEFRADRETVLHLIARQLFEEVASYEREQRTKRIWEAKGAPLP